MSVFTEEELKDFASVIYEEVSEYKRLQPVQLEGTTSKGVRELIKQSIHSQAFMLGRLGLFPQIVVHVEIMDQQNGTNNAGALEGIFFGIV